MTKEAPVQPRQLAWTQTHSGGQTYAVGFYNEFGGHILYEVWHDKEHPGQKWDSGSKKWKAIDIKFPVGTVVCKVLFVNLPQGDVVPSLNPAIQWQGYVTKGYDSMEDQLTVSRVPPEDPIQGISGLG